MAVQSDTFVSNTQPLTSQYIYWWTNHIIFRFLSAVWTLILMAPIHRGSLGEQVMLCYPSKHLTSERRSDHVCITSVSSEPLLEVYWTCRSGSISERLMGTPFVRLWTCKTGSISERLTRDPFGSLLDVQIWFNIWTSDGDLFCTSVDVQNWFNIWTSH